MARGALAGFKSKGARWTERRAHVETAQREYFGYSSPAEVGVDRRWAARRVVNHPYLARWKTEKKNRKCAGGRALPWGRELQPTLCYEAPMNPNAEGCGDNVFTKKHIALKRQDVRRWTSQNGSNIPARGIARQPAGD